MAFVAAASSSGLRSSMRTTSARKFASISGGSRCRAASTVRIISAKSSFAIFVSRRLDRSPVDSGIDGDLAKVGSGGRVVRALGELDGARELASRDRIGADARIVIEWWEHDRIMNES